MYSLDMEENAVQLLSQIDFNPWSIVLSLIFSSIGLWMFREGRRKQNQYWIYIGVVLFGYTYIFFKPAQEIIIGSGLCYFAYVKRWG